MVSAGSIGHIKKDHSLVCADASEVHADLLEVEWGRLMKLVSAGSINIKSMLTYNLDTGLLLLSPPEAHHLVHPGVDPPDAVVQLLSAHGALRVGHG